MGIGRFYLFLYPILKQEPYEENNFIGNISRSIFYC